MIKISKRPLKSLKSTISPECETPYSGLTSKNRSLPVQDQIYIAHEEDIDMNRFDFTPYRRSTVGFDRLFDLLENNARAQQSENYPPFNIERTGDDEYRITLAVAGFKEDEIEITAQQNLLLVVGNKNSDDHQNKQFLHMGIANRNFERRFELADFVRVENASLADGLLVIDLLREIPDAMKPQTIAINKSNITKIADKRDKAKDKAA